MAIMTKHEAVKAIAGMVQLSLSDIAKVRTVYDALDLDTLAANAAKRVEVKDWQPGDRAPTGMLYEDAHPELKEGAKAYYVYVDGKLALFQYIDPFTGKSMKTDDDFAAAKAKHQEQVIESLVSEQIINEILARL